MSAGPRSRIRSDGQLTSLHNYASPPWGETSLFCRDEVPLGTHGSSRGRASDCARAFRQRLTSRAGDPVLLMCDSVSYFSGPPVAFLEEDHVDDLRLGVAAMCVRSRGEVQGGDPRSVQGALVCRVEVADHCERGAVEGGTSETKAEEAVEGWDAAWTVPVSVDTRLSCPIRRESEKWVRHAAHLRRSTRSSR